MKVQVNKTMKHFTLLLIFSLFLSSEAYAWTRIFDLEGMALSETKLGFAAKSLTKLSNQHVHGGNMSLEMGITAGDTGFHTFGAELALPPIKQFPGASPLGEGSELWYRVWYYFPNGFDFTSGGAGLKLSRIHTSSGGYMTLLIRNGLKAISEVGGAAFYSSQQTKSLGSMVPTGQWHAIEHYVKLHSQAGKGIYRIWQNGNLIFEDTQNPTLANSSSVADRLYLFTYWNDGAPKTQSLYVDDWVVTTDRPGNTDSHGNPFIGIGNAQILASPNPPNSIR